MPTKEEMHARSILRVLSVAAAVRNWKRVALFTFLAVAGSATPFLDSESASIVGAVAMFSALAVAGRQFIVNSRSLPAAERRAWTVVGWGMWLIAGGLLTHAVLFVFVHDMPTFGPIDFFWLAGYGLTILGLSQLPHTSGSRWQRWRLLLDGIIGAVAAGALMWTFVFANLPSQLQQAPTWQKIVGSIYVVLDVMIIFTLLVVVIRRSTFRFDRRLLLVGAALIVEMVADYRFLTSGLGQTFVEAEPLYPLHILAAALLAATAFSVARLPEPKEYAERSGSLTWAMLLPYGLTAVVTIGAIISLATGQAPGLAYAVALIGLLVIGRQSVTIREARLSLDQQRAALAASISHELRTPLTTMVGYLELLDSDAIDDLIEQREMVSIANSQAAYLSRIVSDLVMLASEAGQQMDIRIRPTPIDELSWCAVDSASLDLSHTSVSAASGIVALIDEDRIEQALVCLLNNASRYGGESVELVAAVEGGDLVFEVHDDGTGVSRRHELRIWEIFERGPNRLNSLVPGSGIGLAVTSEIARAHGGAVGYRRSRRLGGSCFWIRIPGSVETTRPTATAHRADTTFPANSEAQIA